MAEDSQPWSAQCISYGILLIFEYRGEIKIYPRYPAGAVAAWSRIYQPRVIYHTVTHFLACSARVAGMVRSRVRTPPVAGCWYRGSWVVISQAETIILYDIVLGNARRTCHDPDAISFAMLDSAVRHSQ